MPQVDVKCSVSNCSFWGDGNLCSAPAIMVDLDSHADYDVEVAGELGIDTSHQDTASHSAATCCRTFKPKQ